MNNGKPSSRPRVGDRGKDFMTVGEVAYASGIGRGSIYGLVRDGTIKSIKIGERGTYIPRVEYERWLKQFTETSGR